MYLLALAAAAALSTAGVAGVNPATPLPTLIPPATIDETLEITGEALEAELGSRMYIDVAVNGRGPYRFLVDSGADRSAIGAGLAERLGLPGNEIVNLRSMAGTSQVGTVRIASLKLGSSELTDIIAPALPERHLGAQGLVGIDALVDQRIMLDFDARTVTIQDSRVPQRAAEPGEIVVTARRRKGQLILTQVNIDGAFTYAVIDTGSELTLANSAMLSKISRGRRRPPLRTVTLTSVTGESFEARVATLPDLRIGGIVMKNVTVAFTDAPPFALFGLDKQPALLLGTDLLKNFRRLSLDFRNRKVRFSLRR
jgi:predicted aspartyl protease